MAKQTTTFELMLPPRDAGVPAYRWLYDALRIEILGAACAGGSCPARGSGRAAWTGARDDRQRSTLQSEGRRGALDGDVRQQVLPDDLLKAAASASAGAARVRRSGGSPIMRSDAALAGFDTVALARSAPICRLDLS
jgi:hypothetical protein